MAHVSGKDKIKKHVETKMQEEVKNAKKRDGYRLVKGEAAGKLAIRTDEFVTFRTKKEAMEHINCCGRSSRVEQEDIDDHTEGSYITIEVWKVIPKNSEAYYWFIEKI